MTTRREIHVNIGEVKTGKNNDVLKALLGSCVGIAFIWPQKKRFGLAHCLLPEAPAPSMEITGKWVSQAIPSLMALLKIHNEDVDQIEVFVAGGGNMMSQIARRNNHIGAQNIEAAKKYLAAKGLKIKKLEVGGDEGRQIILHCETSTVEVKTISKDVLEVKS